MQSKSYPYTKSVMLNAVYDALDSLGADIEQANSERGMILVNFGSSRCRILLETVYPAKTSKLTLLQINNDRVADTEWTGAFFDEVLATLQRSYGVSMKTDSDFRLGLSNKRIG